MLRDLRIFRRNSGKISSEEANDENLPTDPPESSAAQMDLDPGRPPLNTIPELALNPRLGPEQETISRRKLERTPSKNRTRGSDAPLPFRTPEKLAAARSRFGWVPRNGGENGDEVSHGGSVVAAPPISRGLSLGNSGWHGVSTPRTYRTGGKASSVQSDTSSTQSTPTKSVTKPACSGFSSSRPPLGAGPRAMNFSTASKGAHTTSALPTVVNTVEVPHFELREDPSFWLDHNVQVVIRVRPLSSSEKNLHGYNRCLKQESSQNIVWIAQPEARFTFDHVACESVDQEMLFRVAGLPMVENCISGYNSSMFAYGQTGSGKTYTMLGEIDEHEFRPSPDRGMTPRIFEFLFARIRAEEESRRDEKLKYSCRCSFLEIYNEQVTDLLEPSSTNLLLREDLQKGVYVENLTEFEVETVNDILKLLFQGAANRKVAATNMNRESSRSHSVFTCVIESRWEKDSMTNLRFARLNLVDLAGSERQKTSGAEGERLKEAANINKSLSTLGHVIMILADMAHGKQRHVPYRDSRLTFLLQDSLGGNSKTMIIANVSPSICCANETLSTLKFAQRAKLIQNNAVVNEDASGDIIALQHQIRLLKEELSVLKRQNVSRSLSFRSEILEDFENNIRDASASERLTVSNEVNGDKFYDHEPLNSIRVSTKQLKALEATLAGALRREKMAETTIKQLEAEIEQLNRLVRQREEDTRCSKMMLKFREDKICRMESLLEGVVPTDSYFLEENNALTEEIQLLRSRADRNPEVTRFALENIRLLDQLRRYQDFYDEGERELLLTEVSELRNQLMQILEGKSEQELQSDPFKECQLEKTCLELENCRNDLKSCLEINTNLTREINDLHTEIANIKSVTYDSHVDVELRDVESCFGSHRDPVFTRNNEELISKKTWNHTEELLNLQLELDILKEILREERSVRLEGEKSTFEADNELQLANKKLLQISKQNEDMKNELKDSRSLIEALESQNMLSINELDELRESNNRLLGTIKRLEEGISFSGKNLGANFEAEEKLFRRDDLKDRYLKYFENEGSPLQEKLKKMQASLEKARMLNNRYQCDQASQNSHERETEEVCRQVEAETAEVIICLQEELLTLQQHVDNSNRNELLAKECLNALQTEMKELHEKIYLLNQENERLSELVEEKERGISSLTDDWENLTHEIAAVLAEGNSALEDASNQVNFMSSSFHQRSWIGEQVGRIVRSISEKDVLINELQKHVEDAQHVRCDMEWKLRSLRGATLAITEAQQQENSDREREILGLTSQLSEKMSIISKLQDRIKLSEDHMRQSEICATVAFVIVNRLSEVNAGYLQELKHAKLLLNQSGERIMQKDSPHHVQLFPYSGAEKEAQDWKLLLDLPQGCDLKSLLEDCDKKPLLNVHEQNQTSVLDGYIEKEEENAAKSSTADELSVARGRLNEFKMGVQNLHSCMHGFAREVKGPAEVCSSGEYSVEIADNDSEDRVEIKSTQDVIENDKHDVQNVPGCSIKSSLCEDFNDDNIGMLLGDAFNREATIALLKKELDFALGNLKDAQARMDKLHNEKEKIKKSEIQNREKLEQFRAEVLQLRSEIISKEEYFVFRMQELEHKLQNVEENAVASSACLRKEKEVLEFELIDAKASASQKAHEASNLLTKIEEAQKTMQEADIMVNALIEAKESANLEIQRRHNIEVALYSERSSLISKIEDLQSNLNTKEQQYEYMEMSHRRCLTEANTSIQELENMFRHLQAMFTEKFELITCDLHWLKSHLQSYTDSARTLLEQTWTEIIGKDCAVSVLHLCHMGILLERITGLNAENGFLYHGLCESDSLIADLRQHNVRAEKELEICSILKGKLLVDINNSFNRISKKECEALEFKAKLNSFEQKILNLQLQEESMLARSNLMGSELAILMEEFDKNNRNALTAASVHEKLSREKEESYRQQEQLLNEIKSAHEMLNELFCQEFHPFVNISSSKSHIMLDSLKATGVKEAEGYMKLIQCQAESIMMDMLARDLELLVMESELEQKITECNEMVSQIVELERERDTFCVFVEKASEEIALCKIDGELKSSEMHYLLVENEKLKSELVKLELYHYKITECLQELERKFASSVSQLGTMEQENSKLHDIIFSLEASLNSTKINLEETSAKLAEVQCSHVVVSKELDMKTRFIEIQTQRTSAIKSENDALRKEKEAYKRWKEDIVAMLQIKSLGIAESVEMAVAQMNHISDKHFVLIDKMCCEMSECSESASNFAKELESLELSAKSLISDNLFLQSELMRKDELSKGLLFDLSLLQESASIARDQKDEIQEMATTLRALEDEVALKSCELHEAVAHGQIIEAELLEKHETISAIQLELAEKDCILDQISSENIELKVQLENIIGMNHNIEKELIEKIRATEKLEEELLMMVSLVGQKNQFLEALQNDITKLTNEKVCLDSEMLSLKEQLEMAHSLAEENEAIATEARQIAEGSKVYAEEKEEEVKLLEKSVEELECTIYALENKVEIVKGETERQRLQKEELARELEAVKYQMLTVHASDSNIARQLEEKESELRQAQENIQYLLKDIADKNTEIAQCKEHISELNMHADAQAREYKQKFRELEAMAHQVKVEPTFSTAMSLSCKSEKSSAKPRGSGSPFKCIGLGLTQQINSEKDEELTTARRQIQELEALVASRQKEIFMLNTRLATAESMTHDVIRDLLGVKLDMTNYASLLDEKHIQKAKQEAPTDGQEYHDKDEEVTKLKRQLNEFIKERQSWIDEINRKHTEMVAAQVLVEKLQQKEQLLTIENDMLKVDNAKNRKMAIELDDEIRKVSSQQNLHMRIHHHAKIKEENNLLKVQNEELIAKLQRSEAVLSRVKEELACYRASSGKNPYIDFDKEGQLERKLNDTEDERIQLAQNMLSLCTSILKAAGLTESASNISISAAENALCQLKERNSSLESELQDLKLKCKIYREKFRLFELEQQSSALRLQGDESCSSNSTSSD